MSAARRTVLAALLAAGAIPATASGATVTIGTTLDLVTANSNPAKTCADGTWWYAEQGVALGNVVPTGDRTSCQFTASGIYGSAPFGLFAPGSGTAKLARIKVGSITGPMRINVVRTLFQQTGSIGNPFSTTPFLQQYGPTFTPAANSVTEVPLNLPMRSQATPDPSDTSTVAGTDWLALEVLAPNVPVPLVPYQYGSFFAAFPGPTAGNVSAPSSNALPNYGQNGYVLAMNADIELGSSSTPSTGGGTTGGGGGGAGGATGGAGAAVSLGAPTAKVRAGRASIRLTCAAACKGKLALQSKSGRSYGKASFTGKAGANTVRVALNSRGRTLMRRSAKASVQALVKLDGSATPTTLAVTLRR